MPKTKHNVITAGWTGALGKQVVFRQLHGQTVSSAYPDMSNRVLTAKQLKINELMKEANIHARLILTDEQSRHAAQVRLDVPRNKLYTALIKEYYKDNYQAADAETPADQTQADEGNYDLKENYDFMKYLLQNTSKSIEDISRLTKIPLHTVFTHQARLRKPEESDEELLKKFQETRAL